MRRHRPDWVRVAVNGRMVVARNPGATLAFQQRISRTRDRYPYCFLHLRAFRMQWTTTSCWCRNLSFNLIWLQECATKQFTRSDLVNNQETVCMFTPGILPSGAERCHVVVQFKSSKVRAKIGSCRAIFLTPTAIVQYVALKWASSWLYSRTAHVYERRRAPCVTLQLFSNPSTRTNISCTVIATLNALLRGSILSAEQVWAVHTLMHRDDCAEALLELAGWGLQTAQVTALPAVPYLQRTISV